MHKSYGIVDDSVQADPTGAWSCAEFFASRAVLLRTSASIEAFDPGEPERVPALFVTDGVLPILGVTLFLGRSLTRADYPTI
jgi:hypothetical protein